MPYTHFRFIAWEVPTATQDLGVQNSPVVSGFAPGNECAAVVRLPVTATVAAGDARTRLARLAAVVDRAATRVNAIGGDNNQTLKIFIAPEFYFRPPVTTGPNYDQCTYPQAEMFKIWGALDLMFQHADFTHWLIVPGTVMWNRKDQLDAQRNPKTNYFNSALWVRGGPVQQATRIIEKQLASGIDGVPQAFAPGADAQLKPIYEEWRNRKLRVFTIDGSPMGLEVCLDHGSSSTCRVLKRTLNEWSDKENGQTQNVSLHLITAGGMPLQPYSVSAKVNGYVLRNDGFTAAPHSELRKVESYKMASFITVQPSSLWGTANLAAGVGNTDNTNLAGDELVTMLGGTNFEFQQRIVIYPSQALA